MANRGLLTPFSPAKKPWAKIVYRNLDKILYLSQTDMGKNISIDIANSYAIYMPSGLQLKLERTVIISNISSSAITIGNNAGTTINSLAAGKNALYQCTDKTTVAGTWTFTLLN